MVETIDGSSREIAAALQRMRELAVQAASDTYGVTDRAALDLEFGQLMAEMQRIATQTTWNEITVMDGNSVAVPTVTAEGLTVQLGKASGQNMTLTIKSFDPRTTVRAAARLEQVNPATGAVIPNPLVTTVAAANNQNLITAAGAIAGGLDHVQATGSMTVAEETAALIGGLDYSGNDNHVLIDPGTANRRDAETQAFGRAVLYVGNNLGTATATQHANTWPANPTAAQSPAGVQRVNLLSRINATYTLHNLDIAISAVSAERAKYGSYISRLEHAGDNLTNVARHQEQSRSRIADADYAVETSELSRTTIIAQASTAMLAQANAAKQTVLTLLQ
jgi:flagellin